MSKSPVFIAVAKLFALSAKYKIGPAVTRLAILRALRKSGRSFGMGGSFFFSRKKIGAVSVKVAAKKSQKSNKCTSFMEDGKPFTKFHILYIAYASKTKTGMKNRGMT